MFSGFTDGQVGQENTAGSEWSVKNRKVRARERWDTADSLQQCPASPFQKPCTFFPLLTLLREDWTYQVGYVFPDLLGSEMGSRESSGHYSLRPLPQHLCSWGLFSGPPLAVPFPIGQDEGLIVRPYLPWDDPHPKMCVGVSSLLLVLPALRTDHVTSVSACRPEGQTAKEWICGVVEGIRVSWSLDIPDEGATLQSRVGREDGDGWRGRL